MLGRACETLAGNFVNEIFFVSSASGQLSKVCGGGDQQNSSAHLVRYMPSRTRLIACITCTGFCMFWVHNGEGSQFHRSQSPARIMTASQTSSLSSRPRPSEDSSHPLEPAGYYVNSRLHVFSCLICSYLHSTKRYDQSALAWHVSMKKQVLTSNHS
jgi:hypothetical protein